MTDRPASWRMPTPKQMEKLAAEASRESGVPAGAPEDPLPAEYWQSVLQDPRAHSNGLQTRQMPLSELQPGRSEAAYEEQLAIVDAIESRELKKAEELARHHIAMAGQTRIRMMFGAA
jgi:hypothetical protein